MNKDKDKEKEKDASRKVLNVDFDDYVTKIPESRQSRDVDFKERLDEVKAAIPGLVEKLLVNEGDEVKAGDILMILEAMKMRNRIYSRIDGTIAKIHVKEGERVVKNQLMITYNK